MVRLTKDFRWKETKYYTLIFEAKYYLVGPKVIIMALYSIFLQTDSSVFLPLDNQFTEPVIFHTRCAPGMGNKMNPITTLSSNGNCPKLH